VNRPCPRTTVLVLALAATLSGPVPTASAAPGGQATTAASPPTVAAAPASSATSAAPAAAPTLIFRDDFSDPTSGWPRRSTAASSAGYEGGEYYLLREAGQTQVPIAGRPDRYGDFRAEVDVRVTSASDDAYAFVNFRRTNDAFYRFSIYPNAGTYMVNRWQRDGGELRRTLLSDFEPAPQLHAGAEWNRIGVQAQGSEIALFVNGRQVAWLQDDSSSDGVLQLGVGDSTRAQVEARFRDFVVTTPGPVARTVPPRRPADAPATAGPSPTSLGLRHRLSPRPELALTERDLPPGYAESVVAADVAGASFDVLRFQRTGSALGPILIQSIILEAGEPLSQETVTAMAHSLAATLTRETGTAAQLRDWDELDPAGIGERAVLYSFRMHLLERDVAADAAFAVFTRGDLLGMVVLVNGDGRATTDLRQYAHVLDTRLARELAPTP
jgi:hypothetical protein